MSLPRYDSPMSIDIRQRLTAVCLVTKEVADYWLILNTGNRSERPSHTKYLAGIMSEGNWNEDTPQGIAFSDKERLLDGQHRLKAVSMSGAAIWMRVDFGVPDDTREYMDTGIVRTLADRVEFLPGLSGTANRRVSFVLTSWANLRGKAQVKLTPEKAHCYFDRLRGPMTWVAGLSHRNEKVLSRTPFLVAACEMWLIDSQRAEEFYAAFRTPNSSIQQANALREIALRMSTTSARLSEVGAYSRAVFCGRYYLDSKPVQRAMEGEWNRYESELAFLTELFTER